MMPQNFPKPDYCGLGRCVMCYAGHHYQSYALSEELDQWLLFDDTMIKLIGDWRDVKASIKGGRLQPSVLFYERGR